MALKAQMELFDEGGLLDEGGTVDPVSGNDVPPGSTQEEVRDDIPAQLSEGEFVFPADVVRYIGLEKLMQMRQEAKMGLKMMEDMGQMGNSEEAIMPDDIPFDLSDLDMEDEKEYNMNQGGMVDYGLAGTVPSQFANQSTSQEAPTTSSVETPMPATYTPPKQAEVPVAVVPETQPSFEDYMAQPKTENIEYINPETGERRTFTFVGGVPVVEIPEGFIPLSEYQEPTVSTEPVVGTAQVREEEDNDPPQTAEEIAEMRARVNAAKRMGITEQVGFSIAGAFGRYGPEDVGKFTPTGYIIGKDGVLLDPLTGMTREQNSPSMIAGILDAIAGGNEPPTPAYTDEFFDAMPDQAKDVFGRSLGKNARDARMSQQQRDIEIFEKNVKDERLGGNRSALRNRILERDEKEVAKAKNNIAKIQAQARAEIASKDSRQQAAERAIREAGERQEDRNNDGRPDNETAQEAGDRYTAERVAEAIATGDYSRGFAEGGLASKPKPKAKKKMKRGGLASKK